MEYLDFLSPFHNKTKRNYLERVNQHDKADCAEVAIQYGNEYWDGDRRFGYGGYHYDGRWKPLAQKLVDHYQLKPGSKILDVGCGKGFLLHEFSTILEGVELAGVDISDYAIKNAKPEVRSCLQKANATNLPFADNSFDLVISITTLHNLYNYDLKKAIQEIERVGKKHKHIVIESYRNEKEKMNLLYWQLTCRSFYTPDEWKWFFHESGYTGDFGCIYFE